MKNNNQAIIKALKLAYRDAHCELNYTTPFMLLVATILSAQCTDKRVNLVTEKLFKVASTPKDFASISPSDLEKMIYSCGFYKNKAKSIIEASKDIIERFDGVVPGDMQSLTSLKGVGRKTANVVLSEAFNKQAIAVDTHVYRVSKRLGFSSGNNPRAVEDDLVKLFSDCDYIALSQLHHILIFHGRYMCHSQKPNCMDCPIAQHCDFLNNKTNNV